MLDVVLHVVHVVLLFQSSLLSSVEHATGELNENQTFTLTPRDENLSRQAIHSYEVVEHFVQWTNEHAVSYRREERDRRIDLGLRCQAIDRLCK